MDRELLYNKSGIKDETAYKAILRSGGGTGRMNNYEINKGEIWEVDNNGSTRVVVILACFERYAATVMLQEQEPGSNAVAVRARDIMYADAGRLGYVFYDKMVDFVRTLSKEEDCELRRAIAEALVLPDDEAPLDSMAADANREIDGLQYEINQLRQQLKEKTAEAEKAQEEIDNQAEELEKAQEEIDNQAEELEEATNRVAALEEEKKAVAVRGTVELVDDRGLREELAAAKREAEIYKGLYENMLARAFG